MCAVVGLGAGTSGAEREPIVKPKNTWQDSASAISDPGITQGHRAVFRERRAVLQAHHEQLVLQLKESAELLLRPPLSPTLSTNPFSPSYTATAATAATPAQPQPLALPPTQPLVPVTLRAQPLQVEATNAFTVTPGTTTFQLPPPAQPVTTTYQVPSPAQPLPPATSLASSRPTFFFRASQLIGISATPDSAACKAHAEQLSLMCHRRHTACEVIHPR